ncbi:MAG: restriction endonuclease subunit S [Fibrobacter sp.]|nr:restriction endonuclease subunit S [Fibrobacter sp.]
MSEWKKVKIGDVCKIVKGTTGIASAEPGKYPLVVTAVERKTCSTYQFDCEAVCIPLVSSSGHGKKSLNNVHFQSGKFALGTILCAVIPNNSDELDARYLHQYLQFYKDTVLVPLMKGAANVSLSMKDITGVSIPLPPIKRQRELAEMFVTLQEKQKELFTEFEKQTEYAKQLRQNILQEAIEGKLTADWRKQHPVQKGNPDYDAQALFEQIQKEKYHTDLFAPNGAHAKKAKSVSSEPIRVTRKEKSLPPITEDEIPFEIPIGWKWVRLGDISLFSSAGKSFNCESREAIGDEWGIIKTSAITSGVFVESENKFYSKKCNNDVQTKIQMGDFLFCRASGSKGLAGRSCVVEKISSNLLLSDKSIRIELAQGISKSLVNMLNNSQYGENYRLSLGTNKSTSMNNLTREQILNFRIPLPPTAEQKEIVARVEQHIQTITQLETQIATRETTTKQLMQSILKDAFGEGIDG